VRARVLLAAVLFGNTAAAAPPEAPRFAAAEHPTGAAVTTSGEPLAPGSMPPTRPRAGAFVPGQLPVEAPPAARVLPPFCPDAAASFPDRVDVIFYARSRPVRVKVAIRTGGKPLAARWEQHLRKLYIAFDRDGDGFLNRHELEHIFPVAGMRRMFQGEQYYRSGHEIPSLDQIDKDDDNRVSFAEFAYYYREVVHDLVKARTMPGNLTGDDNVTRELFARLDRNGDGKLSEPELRAAEHILLALDADEDECISTQELLANPLNTVLVREGAVAAIARSTTTTSTKSSTPQDVAVYQSGIPGSVVQQVIKRYDRDGDFDLSLEEIGFPQALFDHLDTDGNGKLSANELDGWRTCSPDAVVELELGDTPDACKAMAAQHDGEGWPEGLTVRQSVPGRLVLRVGSQTMEFAVVAPPPNAARQQMQQVAMTTFPEGAEYVEDKDLIGPQNQFLRVVFDDADFNGDGRLTRKEFERYFALQRETTEIALVLTHVVRTPNLFQMLDDNMDGKLGVRELRTAWDRMIMLEPPDSDAVTKAILQPNAAFRLSSAAFANYDPSANINTQFGMGRPDQVQTRGPIWFRKMDRNNDGDVSRSEFLGPESAFNMLDVNGDGLISLEEAEAYEKTARPPSKAQKPRENRK
jgi:Ca2+-binding EF-hand superfamily protein